MVKYVQTPLKIRLRNFSYQFYCRGNRSDLQAPVEKKATKQSANIERWVKFHNSMWGKTQSYWIFSSQSTKFIALLSLHNVRTITISMYHCSYPINHNGWIFREFFENAMLCGWDTAWSKGQADDFFLALSLHIR